MLRARHSRSDSSITPGAIGAAAGAVIGGATGVLLGSKKARSKVKEGVEAVGVFVQDTISSIDSEAINLRRLAKVGMKGGRSKRHSLNLKQRNRKKS